MGEAADLRAHLRRGGLVAYPTESCYGLGCDPRDPPLLTGGRSTIAVRITAHPVAARLCRSLGMALVSTSANKSSQKPAQTAAECRRMFSAQVRVIAGRIGPRRRPSTLIDLATGTILRP